MTELEIKQSNELIAAYMGIKEISDYYDSYGIQTPCYKTNHKLYEKSLGFTCSKQGLAMMFFVENSKYHTDWNWLMEVVEKINSDSDVKQVSISPNKTRVWLNESFIESKYDDSHSFIERCWLTCIEYIISQSIKWQLNNNLLTIKP